MGCFRLVTAVSGMPDDRQLLRVAVIGAHAGLLKT